MRINNECGQYEPSNISKAWLKDHAGDCVEIVESDADSGLLKVFKVKSLTDETIGTAWSRELVK
jgi:hypothetical protein